MLTLLRLIIYAVAGYLFFLFHFPQWHAHGYHLAQFSLILVSAIAVFIAIKLIDIGSKVVKLAVEAGFAVLVFLYLGATLPKIPQGNPEQAAHSWLKDHAPTRKDVSDYLDKAGIKPDSSAGKEILSHWPEN
jgi:hypothetical protein